MTLYATVRPSSRPAGTAVSGCRAVSGAVIGTSAHRRTSDLCANVSRSQKTLAISRRHGPNAYGLPLPYVHFSLAIRPSEHSHQGLKRMQLQSKTNPLQPCDTLRSPIRGQTGYAHQSVDAYALCVFGVESGDWHARRVSVFNRVGLTPS